MMKVWQITLELREADATKAITLRGDVLIRHAQRPYRVEKFVFTNPK